MAKILFLGKSSQGKLLTKAKTKIFIYSCSLNKTVKMGVSDKCPEELNSKFGKDFRNLERRIYVKCLNDDISHDGLSGEKMKLTTSFLSCYYGNPAKPEYIFGFKCPLCKREISVKIKGYNPMNI